MHGLHVLAPLVGFKSESHFKLPHKVKIQYVHFWLHVNYFLLPWKNPEEISRWFMLFITKGTIYLIKCMSIQSSTVGVDWPKIGCLMEVSIMFDICTYYDFTLYNSFVWWHVFISEFIPWNMLPYMVLTLRTTVIFFYYSYLYVYRTNTHIVQQPHWSLAFWQ